MMVKERFVHFARPRYKVEVADGQHVLTVNYHWRKSKAEEAANFYLLYYVQEFQRGNWNQGTYELYVTVSKRVKDEQGKKSWDAIESLGGYDYLRRWDRRGIVQLISDKNRKKK